MSAFDSEIDNNNITVFVALATQALALEPEPASATALVVALATEEEEEEQEINYKTVKFTPLPALVNMIRREYYGPNAESNKVIEGIYAGAFPGFISERETDNNLINLLNLGIDVFVCLQEEYNPHNKFWRNSRRPVRPYFDDVQRLIKNKHLYSRLQTSATEVLFEHLPIADMKTTDDDKVVKLAKKLVKYYYQGKKLYVHCWGGHGRTGVIVCVMLHLMYGLSGKQAIDFCNFVHGMREFPLAGVKSPQTPVQEEQVERIITNLLSTM